VKIRSDKSITFSKNLATRNHRRKLLNEEPSAKKKHKKKHRHKKKAGDKGVGEAMSDDLRREMTIPPIHRDLQTRRPRRKRITPGAPWGASGRGKYLLASPPTSP
jgi:hypothetical protein